MEMQGSPGGADTRVEPPPPPADLSPATAAALLAVIGVAWLLAAWRFWFVVDDAWITFRYAKHLASGVGLRFNPDDPPIEGFSNPLWMLAAAACEGTGLDPGAAMPVLSI